MKNFYLYVLVLTLFSSCISQKQLTYFQGEPVTKSDMYKLNNDPYRLQVNDILYVDIKAENPEIVALFSNDVTSNGGNSRQNQSEQGLYFTGYTIDRNGNIRIPYIGELNVLGYTTKEVRQKIESELTAYVKKVESIFVTVKLSGINFVVTGEVGSPGTVNLTQNQVTIVDAIASAGDVTITGDRENVVLVRKTIDGIKKYNINLLDIEVFDSNNFYLKPNDVVYVAPLKQKSWGTGVNGFQTFTTFVAIFSFLTTTILLIKTL